MKYSRIILCLVLILLLLAGCGGEKAATVYATSVGGHTLTVDLAACTVTDENGLVYTYTVSSSGSDIIFTYPNGAGSSGGDYDPERYIPGDVLRDAVYISPSKQEEEGSGYGFLGFLLVAFGLFSALTPETSWYLEHGWLYKDAEPSDAALELTRLGGIVVIFIGFILFFA